MSRWRLLATSVIVVCAFSFQASAQSVETAAQPVTIAWDANTEPSVTGYDVYVGASPSTYTQIIDVGNRTTFTFAGGVAGQRYYFAVSAYAADHQDGPRSAEISTIVGAGATGAQTPPNEAPPPTPTPGLADGYRVIARYPHDATASTEGLELAAGRLLESSGLNGASSLRELDLPSGTPFRIVNVPSQYLAEGVTSFQGKIFQLTQQSQVGFIYDANTLAALGQFSYSGQGRGLTHDAQNLIMSDGTNRIRFLDPATFQVVRSIAVTDDQGRPVNNVDELEYINGEIYANVRQTNLIARVDPVTGTILRWIDLTGLLPAGTQAGVLNGIAYDGASGHLLVTGERWPSLFEIEVQSTAPNTPPMVTLTSPPAGAVFTTPAAVQLSATATDPDGAVRDVSFYANGALVGTAAATPYAGSWTNVAAGTYLLTAVAADTSGASTTSAPVQITVTPGATPAAGESPDGSMVPDTTNEIRDQAGNLWTLEGTGAFKSVLQNGAGTGASGVQILYASRVVYVYTGGWYYRWTGTQFMPFSSTAPAMTSPPASSGESPDGSIVTNTTNDIRDQAGNVWTLRGAGPLKSVFVNGTGTSGTGVQLLYVSHVVYLFTGSWYYRWTGTQFVAFSSTAPAVTAAPPPIVSGESPDGSVVPGMTNEIHDQAGNIWTLAGAGPLGSVLVNGAGTGAAGVQILYVSRTVYVYTGSWYYRWTGTAFVAFGPVAPAASSTTSGESPDGSVVPSTTTAIRDHAGDVWTLEGLGSIKSVLRNGQATGAGGIQLLYRASVVYVYTGTWYYRWNGTQFVAYGPSLP